MKPELKNNYFLPNFCTIKTVLILSVAAQLFAFVLILALGETLSESFDELGLLSLFVQWIALGSALILCLTRSYLAKLPLVWSAISAYLVIIITTASIASIAQHFLNKMNYQWGNVPETIDQLVFRSVIVAALMALIALRYFYMQSQWKQRIELESSARVEALQARIRPHFLFNSMNIIASLIQTHPKLAEQAVEDLSELFRAILRLQGSTVSLAKEWQLCENYLRIESLRLGERLKIVCDFTAVPMDASIPMLTLQPLVENAICHGIQALALGGTIEIQGKIKEGMIWITLINPIPSRSETLEGNKMALINITQRLELIFGNHAQLLKEINATHFKVTVIFPYIKNSI